MSVKPVEKSGNRILIVTGSLAQGGGEMASVNLANALLRKNNIVGFAAEPGPLRSKLLPGIAFSSLPVFSLFTAFAVFRELNRIANDFNPEVIHFQTATHGLILKILFLFKKRPLFVLTHHGGTTIRIPDVLSGFAFNIIGDKIIGIALHQRDKLCRLGVAPDKIFIVPNYIRVKDWAAEKNSFNRTVFREQNGLSSFDSVLFVSARLAPSKKIDSFVRIVGEVARKGHNIAGVVLGDGPELENLKELAAQLRLENRVFFPGFVVDVRPYYFASDVFVFPTEREVSPVALLEACAAGLPAVCSNIPGNEEIIKDGINGFLVRGTEAEYSEKIIALISDPRLYHEFSRNTLNLIGNNFDEDICVSKILDVYGF